MTTFSQTKPATITYVPQALSPISQAEINHQHKGWESFTRAVGVAVLSGALAFGVGCGLAATEVTDTPAQATAAILLEVSQ